MSEWIAIDAPGASIKAAAPTWFVMRLVASKEIRDLYRDGRFWCAVATVLLLIFSCTALSWQDYTMRQTARTETEQVVRHQWETQGEKDAHSGAHFGQYAFTPETALAAIDPGIRANTGTAVWLEPHRRNMFRFKPVEDLNSAVRFGVLTPSFLLQVIIPLFLIFFSFSSVAGERESGTLRLAFSLGVTRLQFFAGKTCGMLTAAIPLVMLLLAAVLCIAGYGTETASGDLWLRALLLVPLYGVYWSIWIFVGLGVSCWTRTAQHALVILLAVWVVATVLAPRAGTFIADQLAPPLSGQLFADGIRDDLEKGLDGVSPPEKRYQEFVQKTLSDYGVRSLDEVPVAVMGLRLRWGDAYSEQVHDKHFDALHRNWREQARLALLTAAFSPLPATSALSQSLSGTDVEAHIRFSQASEMYRREFINRTSDEVTRTGHGTAPRPKSGPALWREIERFNYQPPSISAMLRDQRASLALLTLWLVLSAAFAYRSFEKMSVW